MTDLIKLASIAATAWLICLAAMWTADIAIRRQTMQRRKYYRRITYKAKRWGYVAWLHSDPSIRQSASHPQWSSPEEAEAAADTWASEFFIASETPIDAEFTPDKECEGR